MTSNMAESHKKPNIQTIIPPAPVHPLSSLVTIGIDMIWGMIEIGATISVAGLVGLLPLILTNKMSRQEKPRTMGLNERV